MGLLSDLRAAGRARAECFNSWRRCSRPAASPAPFGLENGLGIESVRCSHSGVFAGVEGTAALHFLIVALAERIPRARLRK